jgi:hypothetical protein
MWRPSPSCPFLRLLFWLLRNHRANAGQRLLPGFEGAALIPANEALHAACPDDLSVEARHPEARRKSSTPAKRSPNAGNIGVSTSFEAEGTKSVLYRIDCGFAGVCERRMR